MSLPDLSTGWQFGPLAAGYCPDVADTERLQAMGLRHRFGDRQVLDDVSLAVAPGRVMGLLGPNGAGKTTLIRILFDVIEPDEGKVRWGDDAATTDERRSWGYMPQEGGLYRDMPVLEHLVWLARLRGMTKPNGTTEAEALLDRLGLADRAGDKIKELSGGMVQRVRLAAAMVHDPSVLVLDEPFAGLDPTAVGFLTQVVARHAERGRIVLFSSHQLDLVEDLCEEITMLHHGRVVLQGDLGELRAASDDRYLRVDVVVPDELAQRFDCSIAASNASGSSLRLSQGVDAFEVLAAIRDATIPDGTQVADFAVEAPTLSEMFLAHVGDVTPDEHGSISGEVPHV